MAEPTAAARAAYRPEIDGLRAIAVLAVVAYHLDPRLLPGGFVGVDVFFVISGYLITLLLHGEWQRHGRIDLPAFYSRRAKRLLPAGLLMILVVLLASAVVLGPQGVSLGRLADSVLASLAFLANFYFLANTGGYFSGPADELPLLHLWSLAVEEQFYLVYPLLLCGLLGRGLRTAGVLLLGLCVASLLLAEHWLQVNPAQAFYQMPARFWELALGGLVALSRPLRLPARAPAWIAAAGLALVLFACGATQPGAGFPGASALPAVLGSALLLWCQHCTERTGPVGSLLASRPFVFVGLLSYPLYLWHWPLLAIDRAANLESSSMGWRAGLCLLALALAWLTYRGLEQPVRASRQPPRRILLAAALMIALVAATAVGVGRLDLVPSERAALVERTRMDQPQGMDRCHFGLAARITALPPAECHLLPGHAPRLAIWGDSHALAWQPFAWRLAAARGVSAARFTMDSCPPVVGYAGRHPDIPSHGENCARLNALTLEHLIEPGRFDTVVLAWRWTAGAEPGAPVDKLPAGLDAALSQLSGVPEILLFAPLPELREPAPRCIAAAREFRCAEPRPRFDARTRPARVLLTDLQARYPNLRVIDPTAFFCRDAICPVTRDGYSLFWDDDHVSRTAAEAFAASYLAGPTRYNFASPPPGRRSQ